MYGAIYNNQWVVQLGAQYSTGDTACGPDTSGRKIRSIRRLARTSAAFNPGDLPAVRYTQGLLAITNQHRISAASAGSMSSPASTWTFWPAACSAPASTWANSPPPIASYWVGFGLTWRFGCGGTPSAICLADMGCSCQ